jgi:hypothetical protein
MRETCQSSMEGGESQLNAASLPYPFRLLLSTAARRATVRDFLLGSRRHLQGCLFRGEDGIHVLTARLSSEGF